MTLVFFFAPAPVVDIAIISINEIKNAIAELQAENIKVTQANVIRRLTGKRSKKTIIQHWKTLFPKQTSEETIFDWRDLAIQKPLYQRTNSELGVPTLEQERNYGSSFFDAALFCKFTN